MTAPRATGERPSTIQTVAVLATPLWIILATYLYALASGEARL